MKNLFSFLKRHHVIALYLLALSPVWAFGDAKEAAGGLVLCAGLVAPNSGRFINTIAGINGVQSPGTAIVNLPVNQRYHRITFNVTNAGNAVAVSTVITGIKVIVGGITVRDISPSQMIAIAQANGYFPALGELPIFFTEAYARNVIEPNDSTSWDMTGQTDFRIQLTIANGVTPAVSGWYEFDYLRNLIGGKPYLQVVAQHAYAQQVAVGSNDITVVPSSFPIRRLWFVTTTANAMSALEIEQDGNKVFEGSQAQMRQAYKPYGFHLRHEHSAPFQNATGPANLSLDADLEGINYFDFAYVADPDFRLWKALHVANKLRIKTTNTAAESMTIIAETITGIYA